MSFLLVIASVVVIISTYVEFLFNRDHIWITISDTLFSTHTLHHLKDWIVPYHVQWGILYIIHDNDTYIIVELLWSH